MNEEQARELSKAVAELVLKGYTYDEIYTQAKEMQRQEIRKKTLSCNGCSHYEMPVNLEPCQSCIKEYYSKREVL